MPAGYERRGGGSSGSAASSLSGVGFHVPKGSLARYSAAKATTASALLPVVMFGDSTLFGQTLSGNFYSFSQRLIANAQAAGMTYAGRGIIAAGETAAMAPDGLAPEVSKTGFALTDANSIMNTSAWKSTAQNDTITLQGTVGAGAANGVIKLWFTQRGDGGTATYAVDGGATTPVNTNNGTLGVMDPIVISGLSAGVHTITIVNTSSTANNVIQFAAEFSSSVGLVLHKHGVSGISASTGWFPANANANAAAALGLASTNVGSAIFTHAQSAAAGARRPVLSIFSLGMNDMQGNSGSDAAALTAANTLADACSRWAEACRVAQCDALVTIPHLAWGTGGPTYQGRFRAALLAVAASYSLPWVDFQYPVGAGTGSNNPHLTIAQYQAQADFLWNNVLAPTVVLP